MYSCSGSAPSPATASFLSQQGGEEPSRERLLMPGGMYVIQSDGQLLELSERAYDSEDLLQGLLARYPSLLAGDQIDPAAPRRWALVRREVSVPGEEGGAGRWSIDHLFLDQDAIPTIVEVKRSSDTRIRREVVGQMLDYAANAVVYWPVERLRTMLEETHGQRSDEAILGLIGDRADLDAESFWQRVKTNLQAGRVRMVFVADRIPPELQRVVEFLNNQMDPAQVLAVEIRQYVGEGLKTLVPRVIGQTAEAQQKKSSSAGPTRKWDEESFLQELAQRKGADVAGVAHAILDWVNARKVPIWWGEGRNDGSFFPMPDFGNVTHWTIAVWTYGKVEIQFQHLQKSAPFDQESMRRQLRERLNAIDGVSVSEDALTKRPNIALSVFLAPAKLQQLLAILDWMLQELKTAARA